MVQILASLRPCGNPDSPDNFRGDSATLIRKGATIGANATIVCGVEMGAYSLVGAGAVVTKNSKDFSVVYGTPARHQGWISKNADPLIFNEKGQASCPSTRQLCRIKDGNVTLCQ